MTEEDDKVPPQKDGSSAKGLANPKAGCSTKQVHGSHKISAISWSQSCFTCSFVGFCQNRIGEALDCWVACQYVKGHEYNVDDRSSAVLLIVPQCVFERDFNSFLIVRLLNEPHDFVSLNLAPLCVINCFNWIHGGVLIPFTQVKFGGVVPDATRQTDYSNRQ